MPIERLTINISGKRRRETLEGIQYSVVPAAMLAEDVVNGSQGPLYYPGDEIEESVPTWDHKPVVVFHPEENGAPSSACDPAVLEAQKVGIMLNTGWDSKLRTEVWIDEEKCKKVDDRVITNIDAGTATECSTGVRTKNVTRAGEFNGKKYKAVATKLKGDHLAILPDGVGAYSIAAGGGLMVANSAYTIWNKRYSKDDRKKMAGDGTAMKDGSFPIANEADLRMAVRAVARAKNPAEAKRFIVRRARALGLHDALPTEWQLTGNLYLAANELSFSDTQCQVNEALSAKYGKPGKYWGGYVCEIYPDRAIFRGEGDKYDQYWMIGYTVKNDQVTLDGEASEVEKVFQEVSGGATYTANEAGNLVLNSQKEKKTMAFDKAKHVAGLIGNGFEESDRKWLEALPDDNLAKITPKTVTANASSQNGAGAAETKPATTVTTPATGGDSGANAQKALTLDDIIGNTSKTDPNAARMLKRMSTGYLRQRAKAVATIKAGSDRFTDDILANMDDDALDILADTLGAQAQQSADPVANFFGKTGTVVGNQAIKEDALGSAEENAAEKK